MSVATKTAREFRQVPEIRLIYNEIGIKAYIVCTYLSIGKSHHHAFPVIDTTTGILTQTFNQSNQTDRLIEIMQVSHGTINSLMFLYKKVVNKQSVGHFPGQSAGEQDGGQEAGLGRLVVRGKPIRT